MCGVRRPAHNVAAASQLFAVAGSNGLPWPQVSHHSPSRGATMKTRSQLILALGLAALFAAGGGFVALRTIPAVAEEPKAEAKAEAKAEDKGLDKDRRAAFIAAYERGDAKAV